MFSYEIIQSLNNMELLVYDYLMKNKEKITYMTVRELADEVHVSTATVMREAKQVIFIGLGTSGILGKYGARFFLI